MFPETTDLAARPAADEAVLGRLRAAVGEEHVRAGGRAVADYSKDCIPWQRTCAAVVFPGSSDEVAEVVRAAAQHRRPVWAFSKGKNWGYGATMAGHDGAVILILERMNRIHEVNEELAYAVIEPGVTQQQLNEHLKARGIKLWADCTDSTPEGSVLGNALERGLGYTPYGDHFGHLCGLEVVLPDGTLLRTGGGPDNCHTWHTHKWGTGPYLEGLFSQSSFGIVVRAGLWLMPEPEAFNAYFFEMRDERDLPAVLDAVRRLALSRAIQSNAHMVNDFLLLSLLMQYPYDLRRGSTCLPDDVLAELRRKYGLAPWTLLGGVYGSPAQVRASRALIRRELSRFGKLTFADDALVARLQWLLRLVKKYQGVPVLSSVTRLLKNWLVSPAPDEVAEVIPHIYPILKGIPGEFIVSCAYFKSRRGRVRTDVNPGRDDCGLIWFAPVVPLTARHTQQVLDICRPAFRKHGIEFSMSFIMANPRTVVMLMEIFYDKDSPDESARAAALYDELCESTVRAGYQQYRTSVAYMDRILKSAPELHAFANRLKAAADPDSVLAPGRYGVGVP
jgi:4-cresol dehydrogenase (hydroxylating)